MARKTAETQRLEDSRLDDWWNRVSTAVRESLGAMPEDIRDELLQEFALRTLEALPDGKPLPTPSYVVQFIRWRYLDYLRGYASKTTSMESLRIGPVTEPPQERQLLIEEVRQASKQLPPAEQQVFELWLQGESAPGIARIVGKKPSTVRSLLRHARHRITESVKG